MIDVTTLTDADLATLLAAASKETQARQVRADIPRRLEAAIAAAQDAGIQDVEQLITTARSRAGSRGRGMAAKAAGAPAPPPPEPVAEASAPATLGNHQTVPAPRIEQGDTTP